MTQAERERFHNLLLMAKESPFAGERRNALAAAERMAERHGMTLEEAAASGGEGMQQSRENAEADRRARARARAEEEQAAAEAAARERAFAEMARFMHDMEQHVASDKARRDEALKAAYARGLDAEERRREERRAKGDRVARRNSSRRNPLSHANVLLRETRLPLREIASICGLDVWTVAGLKLKMRQ